MGNTNQFYSDLLKVYCTYDQSFLTDMALHAD